MSWQGPMEHDPHFHLLSWAAPFGAARGGYAARGRGRGRRHPGPSAGHPHPPPHQQHPGPHSPPTHANTEDGNPAAGASSYGTRDATSHAGGGSGSSNHNNTNTTTTPPPYNELNTHPLAQAISSVAEAFFTGNNTANTSGRSNSRNNNNNDTQEPDPFYPPLDLFATPQAYILHLAVPGAKKEDVGVDWNPNRSHLRVAGVIHRPGDEALLAALRPEASERKVGYFERTIKLPPGEQQQGSTFRRTRVLIDPEEGEASAEKDDLAESREEIDVEGITAKMEDGILMVTVPKIEKGWTQLKRVDVE